MSEPEALTIQTPNFRLAAKAWGERGGLPVVALHGWLDNANTWDRLAPLLPELRLIAIDSPGHGLSEHRHQPPYHFIDFVAEIMHALEVLVGLEGETFARPTLLGHSMGAGIASILCGARPDRIRGAVLVEGLGPLTEAPDQAVRRLGRAVDAERRKAGQIARASAVGSTKPPKKMKVHASLEAAAERVAEVAVMSPESALRLVERGLKPVEGGFVWAADSRLRVHSRLYLTEELVLAYLGAVTCPTLLIKSRSGYPFDWPRMQVRLDAMADATLTELDGGHHVHLDDPESVAAIVRPFLARLATGTDE